MTTEGGGMPKEWGGESIRRKKPELTLQSSGTVYRSSTGIVDCGLGAKAPRPDGTRVTRAGLQQAMAPLLSLSLSVTEQSRPSNFRFSLFSEWLSLPSCFFFTVCSCFVQSFL